MSRLLLATALAVSVGAALPALAATETFHARLSTADEVPPKATPGAGTATATLDPASGKLDYEVTFSGLTGPATMAHIHGPAAPGANAGVVVPLGAGPVASPTKGSATLTPAQVADLEAGKYYVNVHTAANPGGEVRGQLTK